jgi:Fe-S cluster biosynthesis and repair protein YggX
MLINEYRLNPLDPKSRQFLSRRNGEIPVRRRRQKPRGYVTTPDTEP